MELLVARESDTMRWSALLTRQFQPDVARLPRDVWRDELLAYDRLLIELLGSASGERVRAELEFARVWPWIFIDRRWDWIDDADRQRVLALLREQRERHGDLPLPGSRVDAGETVGTRATFHESELERLRFGAVAPPTLGIDLAGDPFDLADHRGEIVVLDFWTSFCAPCLALVPGANDMMAELDGAPVVYLGVCGDATRAEGSATATRVGMRWRNLWDAGGRAAEAWGVPAVGWPSVFVLDRDLRIRAKLRGKEMVERDLVREIRTLLSEEP